MARVASGWRRRDSSFFLRLVFGKVSVYFRFDDLLAPLISTIGRDWLQATTAMGGKRSFARDFCVS
jgi:hypothetical protein